MVQVKAIQSVITQAATAVVMVMKETDTGTISGVNIASLRDVHRQRHGGPALKQLSFNWSAPDKYVDLLNFETEVTNTLLTKMYDITEEEKSPYLRSGQVERAYIW